MLIALVCGLIAGFGCIIFREHLNSSGQGELWKTINNILFQDITAEGATSAIGIFYIIGQLFVNALQLIIVQWYLFLLHLRFVQLPIQRN